VLGGAGVGVPGQDLGVAERDAGVEGVGDGGVAKRVWVTEVKGFHAEVEASALDLGQNRGAGRGKQLFELGRQTVPELVAQAFPEHRFRG
jgi:hypothetical protein